MSISSLVTKSEELLNDLKLIIGKEFKYENAKLTVIDVSNLDLIVIEVVRLDKTKFYEHISFEDFKYYIVRMEEIK